MSPINSRAKGKRAELQLVHVLQEHWPEARRNLEQHTVNKADILAVRGVHFQCKAVEKLNIWLALEQAMSEAAPGDLPVVAFKRNRSKWFGALELDELIALLRLRET